MYLFLFSWTLGILVLFPSIFVNSRQHHDNIPSNIPNMEHSVRVSNSGRDDPECLKNISMKCKRLDYVFERVKEQNSTVVYVDVGHYILNKSYTFRRVNHIALIGLASPNIVGEVVIQCQTNAGLAFIYSSEIILKNIVLSSCGAIQNSTSIGQSGRQKFLTGLFLVNSINLSVDSVWINESPGIGMQLYDVTGDVSISNSHFVNNGRKQDSLETSFPGGGFYFEFTFMGGLYPFKVHPERMYQENGIFHFINVFFEGNNAPEVARTVHPGGNDHYAFGRGGGASFFIKGSAQNNTFIFENCHFDLNSAEWGAGLFVEFQDNTKTNSFIFQSCHFSYNNASTGGGAMRIGLITKHQNTSCIPNSINFTFCHFKCNRAILGGGISLYGTTKQSYLGFSYQSFINLTHCVIEGNLATVGSAFCSALWNTNQYGVGGNDTLKIRIENSIIESNKIIYTEDKKVSGTGAFYARGTPILLYNTKFISNTKTALVLDSAYVKVSGNVSFIKNTGQRGGAMSLYGTSKVIVSCMANLNFTENHCSIQGGAIYVRTPGPQMVAFISTELMLHHCFFYFENVTKSNVFFYGNKGPTTRTSGHSVYATTLQFCRQPDEGRVNNSALMQVPFHYYYANGTKSDMKNEIGTDAVNIEVTGSDWNTTADKSFSPVVKLSDEKSNSVFGVIDIQLNSEDKDIRLDPSSTYFLAKDKIESLQINAKPKTRYNVSLVTVDSQVVFNHISNAVIKGCEPGFVWKGSSCKCDNSQIGVSRCDDQEQTLFLLKGYWGGNMQSSGVFVIVPCPVNYCHCSHTKFTSSGECLFEKDKQCRGNRENQICGKCKKGFSLKIGDDECRSECNSESQKWIGFFVAILLFLTLLVLFIMLINFDPFSAYLNAWLYSYQVLLILVPGYMTFDPFLTFIIGLAHIQIIGFGGVCMWSNMDDLQKLAFNYLLPFYVFICLCVLNKLVLQWPNNFFTRRFTQTSLARAFCTLFVLSYSTVINISLKIIYPMKVGNEYFVYYQGDVKYWSSYHALFAVIALFLLIFGVFFPLLLIRRQWFKFIDNGLKKLLLDNFQRCFRDGYKWCAGFYFVCRFILFVIGLAVPRGALQVSLLNSVCCVILAVFVFCQPYTDNGGTVVPYRILNISDAVLLCNLCLISSFGGAASGIYAHSYYAEFKTVISVLSYIPLVFSLGLLAYVLRYRYMTRRRHLEDVDS